MAIFKKIGNSQIFINQIQRKNKRSTEEEKKMEYDLKFIPEGWNDTKENYSLEQLQLAQKEGTIIQGFVSKCDENCNLQIHLGKDIVGIVPRNEVDVISQDNFGMTRPSICQNKVNQFIQFKVKEIYDENRLLLSRKEAEKEALDWIKEELEPGMIVNRNGKKYSKIWSFY